MGVAGWRTPNARELDATGAVVLEAGMRAVAEVGPTGLLTDRDDVLVDATGDVGLDAGDGDAVDDSALADVGEAVDVDDDAELEDVVEGAADDVDADVLGDALVVAETTFVTAASPSSEPEHAVSVMVIAAANVAAAKVSPVFMPPPYEVGRPASPVCSYV